jgi:hypothetical protein
MRLIDVRTIELQWFNDDQIPQYAILSHTWGADEVSYQELVWINRIKAFSASYDTPASSVASLSTQDDPSSVMMTAMEFMLRSSTSFATSLNGVKEEDLLKRQGYSKIVNAAREAKDLGYSYLWVDTCCIDKSSSAELQEAINSMFRWYSNAEVCIVYLEDVLPPNAAPGEYRTASEVVRSAFDSSRWTKRGWTLQELVAPAICRFYLGDWRLLGEKEEFLQEISAATGIPVFVLEDRHSLSEVSVAERMSWAAHRQTTRVEDQAYSLLGLFSIHMPLLYGEGPKAFIRLQEEILKTTDDYSLFAWRAQDPTPSTYRGLLARSPLEFRDCHSIEREESLSTFPINPHRSPPPTRSPPPPRRQNTHPRTDSCLQRTQPAPRHHPQEPRRRLAIRPRRCRKPNPHRRLAHRLAAHAVRAPNTLHPRRLLHPRIRSLPRPAPLRSPNHPSRAHPLRLPPRAVGCRDAFAAHTAVGT